MDEEIEERQQVTVGKPLVSKLCLHERQLSPSVPPDLSLGSLLIAETSFSTDALSSVASASNTGPLYATADSETSSRLTRIPEETDSSELYDDSQPFATSESLPHVTDSSQTTNYFHSV